MNALTTEIHEESGFQKLMDAVDNRIAAEINHANQ